MKKGKTDLESFRKLFGGIVALRVTETLDEYDFTELVVRDMDNAVEFYFDCDGKFVGINKVTG